MIADKFINLGHFLVHLAIAALTQSFPLVANQPGSGTMDFIVREDEMLGNG